MLAARDAQRIASEGIGGLGGAGRAGSGKTPGERLERALATRDLQGACQPGDPILASAPARPPWRPRPAPPPPDLSPRGPGAQRAASIPVRPVASASRPRDAAARLERMEEVGPRPWQPHPALSPTPIGPVPSAPLSLANGGSHDAGGFPGGGRHREAKARALQWGAAPGAGSELALGRSLQLLHSSTPGPPPTERFPALLCGTENIQLAARVWTQGFRTFVT